MNMPNLVTKSQKSKRFLDRDVIAPHKMIVAIVCKDVEQEREEDSKKGKLPFEGIVIGGLSNPFILSIGGGFPHPMNHTEEPLREEW